MAVNIVLNGQTYTIPEPGNSAWGQSLTDYFTAISSGVLQKTGGSFALTADVNFGATYGLKSKYFTSVSSNPAAAGVIRLASADAIAWRNNANGADKTLAKNTSDQLTYAGTAFLSASGIILPAGFPALTGDVTTSAGSVATTVAAIQGVTVSGVTGTGNVVFSASPTLTGTIAAASMTLSGTLGVSGATTITSTAATPLDVAAASVGIRQVRVNNTDTGATSSAVFTATVDAGSLFLQQFTTAAGGRANIQTSSSGGMDLLASHASGTVRIKAANTLAATFTGANTALAGTLSIAGATTLSALTASTVPYLDSSKILTSSAVTPTELGYVSGVTSAIQTQIDTKSPSANPTFTGTLTAAIATFSGAVTATASGAASTPAVKLSGTPYSAGSATTNKALLLLEDSATSTGWNTAGTWFGINSQAFSGNFVDYQIAGSSKYSVSSTGAVLTAASGAASTPALKLTGTPYSAGSATTNKALVLLENSGTSTGWSTAGTWFGINSTAFSGNFIDCQVAGTSKFSVDSAGNATAAGTLAVTGNVTLSGTGNSVGTITSGTWSGSAIVYSKLALTGAILNADLAGSIAASKLVGTDIATVGTLTAGATGAGFTVALSTSTITGTLAAARLPAFTGGDVTASAGTVNLALVATSNATLATLSNAAGVAVHGTNTNNDASAGYIGEYVSATQSSFITTNTPTSAQFSDLLSISLTAGDWDVTASVTVSLNGATVTILKTGISTTSGNFSTGLAEGTNLFNGPVPAGSNNSSAHVPKYRLSLSGTTTVYLKQFMSYSVATPSYACSIQARRVR